MAGLLAASFSILAFIFMIGLLILIHEFGHYIMAKKAGILCHEFALGMGPVLFSIKRGETTFSLRAIPIGGFVSMAGEEISNEWVRPGQSVRIIHDKDPQRYDDAKISHIVVNLDDQRFVEAPLVEVESVDLNGKDHQPLMLNEHEVARDAMIIMRGKMMQIAPYERSFESKTLWQRFSTIFAGPFMNFVLALFLFLIIGFVIGTPDVSSNEIGQVSAGAPASEYLEAGDRLIAVEGEAIESWRDIGPVMRGNASEREMTFTVLRGETEHTFTITPLLAFFNAGFSGGDYTDEVIVATVGEPSPASKAGMEAGDEILAIDGVIVNDWGDVITLMDANKEGHDMTFVVLRDGEEVTFNIEVYHERFLNRQNLEIFHVQIGIAPNYEHTLLGGVSYGAEAFAGSMMRIFHSIGALFFYDRIGLGELAGPVGIFQMTAEVARVGIIDFLGFTALLSINLGIINLLPIPALDGGRLVFLGYEAVARRPVNKRLENTLHFVMFILLMTLLLVVTWNEITR